MGVPFSADVPTLWTSISLRKAKGCSRAEARVLEIARPTNVAAAFGVDESARIAKIPNAWL